MPPTSAWCARLATKKPGSPPALRHHRDVGQVRAAQVWIVEHHNIARGESSHTWRATATACGHRAQVHRDVRCLGDHAPVVVKDGAREIAPLFDVGRVGGALQRRAHLLGDRGEQVLEHFEADRINHGSRPGYGIRPLGRTTQGGWPSWRPSARRWPAQAGSCRHAERPEHRPASIARRRRRRPRGCGAGWHRSASVPCAGSTAKVGLSAAPLALSLIVTISTGSAGTGMAVALPVQAMEATRQERGARAAPRRRHGSP